VLEYPISLKKEIKWAEQISNGGYLKMNLK
jgi:hypothetical protein